MNKKTSLIVAVVMALLGIILVSTFGLLPEDLRENVKMQELYFTEKVITKNFKANDNTINLYDKVVYAPNNTTNVRLQFSTDKPNDKVTISSSGLLTVYDLSVTTIIVTVKSTDNSNLSAKITIKKPSNNESNYNDENWEWGWYKNNRFNRLFFVFKGI